MPLDISLKGQDITLSKWKYIFQWPRFYHCYACWLTSSFCGGWWNHPVEKKNIRYFDTKRDDPTPSNSGKWSFLIRNFLLKNMCVQLDHLPTADRAANTHFEWNKSNVSNQGLGLPWLWPTKRNGSILLTTTFEPPRLHFRKLAYS